MMSEEYLECAFWEPPEAAEEGDPTVDEIWRAVGSSLSQWEKLESALSAIFGALVESRSQALRRAYGILASATGRIQALDAAAEVFFEVHPEADYKAYADIVKVVRWAAVRRNEFAHGTADSYLAAGLPRGGYYLVAPEYNSRKTFAFLDFDLTTESVSSNPFDWARTRYAYTSGQIDSFTKRFSRLEREALNVARGLETLLFLEGDHS